MSKELNQDLILGRSVSTICLRSFGSPGFILLLHLCYQWINSGFILFISVSSLCDIARIDLIPFRQFCGPFSFRLRDWRSFRAMKFQLLLLSCLLRVASVVIYRRSQHEGVRTQFMDSPAGVTAELKAEGWQETWSWFGLIQHFQSFSGEKNIRS